MTYDQNGANDSPEEEREELQAWENQWEMPDALPLGYRDPFEDWPEEECSAEYWIYKRIRDEEGEV